MTHLQDALRLAELGWHVFALGPTGKPYPNCKACAETCTVQAHYEACDHLLCHATYAGTTQTARLNAMWENLPHSLIGLRTGSQSGVVVLDFDLHSTSKNGRASAAALRSAGILSQTVSAKTGGGGLHLFYAHPGTPTPNDNTGKLGPGVDVKGDGGFVVLPPSAKRGKVSYSWVQGLSPWDVKLAELDPRALAALVKVNDNVNLDRNVNNNVNDPERLRRNYTEALELLSVTELGGRNENLYRAACRAGEMVAAGLVKFGDADSALRQAADAAGMDSRDGVRNTIRSGMNRGMNDFGRDS